MPVIDRISATHAVAGSSAYAPGSLPPQPLWVNTVCHLDPKYGGLSSVVPQLASAVNAVGRCEALLAGFCRPGEQFIPELSDSTRVQHWPYSRLDWLQNAAARRSFRELIAPSSGLHIHGLWQSSTGMVAPLARKLKKPYVVSAHGMLESWALGTKRWKKAAYAAIFEHRNLAGAHCLQALTDAEACDYRRFGLRNPIALVPNGVNLVEDATSNMFLERFPELRGKRLILFLGRIHYKKGLDILCRAWARIERAWPEAHLVLAGPDFENTQAGIEQLVDELHLRARVTFTGMLHNRQKWSAFAASECLILPSYSEGLSVSVLEALGTRLPVIVTENCNLPEVARRDCGWVIKPACEDIVCALEDLLNTPSARLREIGCNGRDLVEQRYSWPVVGRQMTAIYEWVQGGGKPTDVEIQFWKRTI
jgi:glycosyltransferase involved in cell wall biosynthesis